MKNINERLNSIRQSGTVALADRLRQLEAGGRKVIPLHTGDPDFATPPVIVDAALKAIHDGQTHYSNSKGLPDLRGAIADRVERSFGLNYHPEKQVLIANGGVHAYFLALSAIVDLGDEVIVPNPTWMSHANIAALAGAKVVDVEVSDDDNFFYNLTSLQAALTPKTKAVVVNYPSNPTGRVPSKDQLKMVVDFAVANDLYIISDEVYDHILFDNHTHTTIASFEGAFERTVVINSFSKTFAMTGWRIGYMLGPENIVAQALKVSQCTITNVTPFIQKAAFTALTHPEATIATKQMRDTYESRMHQVMQMYNQLPAGRVSMKQPQGAFYFFADVTALGYADSEACAAALLDQYEVACVPGSVFGSQGEGYLRFTFAAATDHVLEGMQRFFKFAQQ